MSVNNLFDSISISATGMSAERMRMNVIAENIANIHTTRTEEGGPYRRQYVVFEEILGGAMQKRAGLRSGPGGVRVSEMGRMDLSPKLVYDPAHPDAIKEGPNAGFVAMPDINPVYELVDMISAQRAYEANVQAIAAARSIVNKALEIGR